LAADEGGFALWLDLAPGGAVRTTLNPVTNTEMLTGKAILSGNGKTLARDPEVRTHCDARPGSRTALRQGRKHTALAGPPEGHPMLGGGACSLA